jgi:uncharacterized protein
MTVKQGYNMTEAEPQSKSRMSRRKFLKISGVVTAELALIGGGGFYYTTQIEPNALSVTTIDIPIKNLPDSFEGYRIAHISDIHAGTWMNQERLMTVVDKVNEQNPDIIAITGDYITRGKVNWIANILIEPLSKLNAPDGVVSVLGNHDHWTNPGAVREILKTANIQELPNDRIILERDSSKLAICGVDDVWEKLADLDPILERLPNDDTPAILLAHEPDFADQSAETGRFALQLSGHSHGGQVRLPIIGALALPYLGQKYSMGQYQVRDMIQYTNRGVGMIPPAVRLGCPPEITLITLTRAI